MVQIGEEVNGPSMWVGRGVSIQAEDEGNLLWVLRGRRTEGCFSLESIRRLMEGVAGQESYLSEDLLLRVVG